MSLTFPIFTILIALLGFAQFTKHSFVELTLIGLSCGGLALIYLVAWIGNSFSGLIGTPRLPWQIDLTGQIFTIRTQRIV